MCWSADVLMPARMNSVRMGADENPGLTQLAGL
jgi:hypothetical protein